MDLNFFDIVVILLIILLGLKGLIRGLIKEVFGLVSIVGGVFFASRFAYDLGSYVDTNFLPIENDGVKSLIGFLVLFLLIWGGVQLAGKATAKIMKMSGLGFIDRIGGAAVGSAKILLVFSMIVYAFGSVGFFNKILGDKLENSLMYPILHKTGSFIVNMDSMPIQQAKEKIVEEAEAISQKVKDASIEEFVEEVNKTVTETMDFDNMIKDVNSNIMDITNTDMIKEEK